MSYDYTAAIPATFKKDLDSYLNSRTPVTFLVELRKHLKAPHEDLSRVVGQGEPVNLVRIFFDFIFHPIKFALLWIAMLLI